MTVMGNIWGGNVHFIGDHAERITRIRKEIRSEVAHEEKGRVTYRLADLPKLAEDITSEGWSLKIAP